MIEFRYSALNTQGQTLEGVIAARNEAEAARLLRQKELAPLAIASRTATDTGALARRKSGREEKLLLLRELATLLGAGVPLAEAVDSIGQSHRSSQGGAAFGVIHQHLRGGESFAASLVAAKLGFPEYVKQLAAAGEMTGKLSQALGSAATQMEYEYRMRSEMRNALVYPSVLVVSGIAVVLGIFVFVVPKFANMLKSSRAKIPDFSVWVLQTGMFVNDNLLWVALAGAALIGAAAAALRSAELRARLYAMCSRLPLVGTWIMENEIGRWSAMLATLLENRVPIVKALELAQDGVGLGAVRDRLQLALKEIRAGHKLADALAANHTVSEIGVNLVRVGERSGELPAMLRTLATMYENAGRDRMKRLLALLEPVAILCIGVIVGFIMIAIIMAITSINTITV
jgi:general secretion pathway protein F